MAQLQNAIRLNHFAVTVIDLKCGTETEESTNDGSPHEDPKQNGGDETLNVELQHFIGMPSDKAKRFVVQFDLSLKGKAGTPFTLFVRSLAEFETQEEMDEAFAQSALVQVNAPAIVFPYLRSFVSTLTVNAGLASVVLPAMNFHRSSGSSRE